MDALALPPEISATSPELLIATLIGVVVGLIVGVLPGIGPAAGTAIMLPVAVGFGGTAAIAGLAGIYGAMFGGAVTSILLGIPGDAPSVMTVIDGHALAKRGEAGRALGMSVRVVHRRGDRHRPPGAALGSGRAGSVGVRPGGDDSTHVLCVVPRHSAGGTQHPESLRPCSSACG